MTAPGQKRSFQTLVSHEIFVFLCFVFRHVALAFRTFTFRLLLGIAPAFVVDAGQSGSSLGRSPKVREVAARAEPSSHASYVPRACSDVPLAHSVRLVALRRVRFSLVVEARHVRALNCDRRQIVPSNAFVMYCPRSVCQQCHNSQGQNMSISVVRHLSASCGSHLPRP